MRIVFFGDSLTQGTTGVNFVNKVATAFPAHEFINRGVNGDTSLNLYRRVQADVLDLRPAAVFVMVGMNAALSVAEAGLRPYYRLAKSVPGGVLGATAFRENMRAILGKILAAGIKPMVALPPVEYRPATVDALRQNNAFTREVCAEWQIPTLDVFAAMTPAAVPERPTVGLKFFKQSMVATFRGSAIYEQMRQENGYAYSFDGIHLTETGASALAAQIIPFLQAQGI